VTRETVVEKAHRYLVAGRLIVTHVGDDRIRAKCRGGDTYRVGFDAGQWWCTCPARGDCSHLVALRLVTVQPARPERRG
jgi:uncharacterized Zn finger protein